MNKKEKFGQKVEIIKEFMKNRRDVEVLKKEQKKRPFILERHYIKSSDVGEVK